MKSPQLNEKLLKCVLQYLESHPKNYNQNNWFSLRGSEQTREPFCGSTGCFAGWTCMLTLPEDVKWKDFCSVPQQYDAIAQKKLGLTSIEADYLFGGTTARGPREQYKVILKRVAAIRRGRKLGCKHPMYIYDGDRA